MPHKTLVDAVQLALEQMISDESVSTKQRRKELTQVASTVNDMIASFDDPE